MALRRIVDLDAITLVRNDLIDLPELLRTLERHQVSRIIHTASLTSDIWQHPYRGARVNLEAFLNVYEAARLCEVEQRNDLVHGLRLCCRQHHRP